MLLWLGFLAAGFARLLVWITEAGEKVIPGNSGEFGDHSNIVKIPEEQRSVVFGKKVSTFYLSAAFAEAVGLGAVRFSACSQQEKARI